MIIITEDSGYCEQGWVNLGWTVPILVYKLLVHC